MKGTVVIALLLSGCTSVDALRPDIAAHPTPSRLDEVAYINVLREAFTFETTGFPTGLCYNGAGLARFNPTLAQGYNHHSGEEEQVTPARCVFFKDLPAAGERDKRITRYVEAGFGITDLYCERFFTIAMESAQKRRFARNTGSTLDGLIGAVLSLSGVGTTTTGIVNAGFSAVDTTFKNIDDSFLVAPDLGNVRKLVHAAQGDFRDQAFKAGNMPDSYPAARAVVERYAGFCSYAGMKQLVNDSVTSQTQSLAANKPGQNKSGEPQPGGPPGKAASTSAQGAVNESNGAPPVRPLASEVVPRSKPNM
jgi:hypothetical protein